MATNMNAQRAQYFENWPLAQTGYFTSDDTAFHGNDMGLNSANAQAKNLVARKQSGTVDTVTRAEYNAWYAEYVPAQLSTAQENLKNAQDDLRKVQGDSDALRAKATTIQKYAAKKAVNQATVVVNNAQIDVDTAQGKIDGLNKVNGAEQKLSADALAGANPATISADEAEIVAAKKGKK